jgi:hypothetical protein
VTTPVPAPTADLATNLHTMAGDSTVYMRGIAAAIARAGISPGAAVMLVGDSLGGMTAAAGLPAGDPSYAAWRESARGFLDPDNQARTSTYAITREPPANHPTPAHVL